MLFVTFIGGCTAQTDKNVAATDDANIPNQAQWQLSSEEWKSRLTDFEYYVLRDKGTERAFSGEYWNNKKEGTYTCRACGLALFASKTKYKSGTGWPSFYEPIKSAYVAEDSDFLLGYKRTEVMCGRCGGHLGHVFPDGPKPTGLRYCINSISLSFEAMNEKSN